MLLILIAIGGCDLGKDKKESFAKEYFVNFPEVKNVVKYLEIDKSFSTGTYSDSSDCDFYELRILPNVLIHISLANGKYFQEYFGENYTELIGEEQIEELKSSGLLGFIIQLNRINDD